ncbi:MAG: DUF4395 domain-containing protein [Chlorobiales bacterium]|nr:DUF4395 domain-containing protein [Chlorobiales bacterium]
MSKSPSKDIPLPIVKLNRWVLLIGIVLGALLSQPLFITVLYLILLPAVVLGKRGSLIYFIGSRLFANQIEVADYEDWRLQRFNNTIATTLLCGAQVAFLLGEPGIGWGLSFIVAIAAGIALAGFCVGCFLYFQFKQQRYRLFGE